MRREITRSPLCTSIIMIHRRLYREIEPLCSYTYAEKRLAGAGHSCPSCKAETCYPPQCIRFCYVYSFPDQFEKQ
ncbi:hypothetical protein GDO78_012850 [Eleutherodactylus coqui]|uniref:Uncharacterized protein n=1 Tax=Eleutherodactylus coqui TaxID=57060 RepID=A0A8J6F043_ELECQ|nr:hypothetical protein GDO78_012850 [Eleutherodactylus coqui]